MINKKRESQQLNFLQKEKKRNYKSTVKIHIHNQNQAKCFNGVIVFRIMKIHFVTFTHTFFTLAALSFQKEKKN